MISSLLDKQTHLETTLTANQLSNIHSKPIRNFLNYLPYFKSEQLRCEIINQLNDYFHEIEAKDYVYESESGELGIKYLKKLDQFIRMNLIFVCI